MINIDQRVGKLFHENFFKEKRIVLFNINNETRCTACALINRGIPLFGIIVLDEKEKNTSIWGIPVYKLKDFYREFQREALIVIFSQDYVWWKEWLERKGYYKGHKLLLDLQLEEHGVSKLRENPRFQVYVDKYDKAREAYLGFKICNKLEKKYGNSIPIIVYDYSGMGDTYIWGGLVRAKFGNKIVVIIKKKSLDRILQMYQFENIEIFSETELRSLYMVLRIKKTRLNIYPITPVSLFRYTDIISYLYGMKLSMADIYKAYLNLPLEENIFYYPAKRSYSDVDELFDQLNDKDKKIIVLSPFANSIVTYNYEFWSKLAGELNEKGYIIILNSYGDEYTLPNTITLKFSIEKAEYLVEKAGYFVGIRSGFCDVISNSDAVKIIITPEMEKLNFNNGLFEAFSFERMGVGDNFIEIEWGYSNLDGLLKVIYDKLGA